MTARRRLPDRRLAVTHLVERAKGGPIQIGIGYDHQGAAREVFLNGLKIGSDIEALLQDSCVLISLVLQHGMPAADLADRLGRQGIDESAQYASLVGLVAETVRRAEAAEGEATRMAYRCLADRRTREAAEPGD